MSIEFSQEMESPIITPPLTPLDAGEASLRPRFLVGLSGPV